MITIREQLLEEMVRRLESLAFVGSGGVLEAGEDLEGVGDILQPSRRLASGLATIDLAMSQDQRFDDPDQPGYDDSAFEVFAVVGVFWLQDTLVLADKPATRQRTAMRLYGLIQAAILGDGSQDTLHLANPSLGLQGAQTVDVAGGGGLGYLPGEDRLCTTEVVFVIRYGHVFNQPEVAR
jgi:hypothetical protein